MSKCFWLGSLTLLALVACGSSSNTSATVQGTDAASLKVSPGGVATLVFLDVETIRPDDMSSTMVLPGGQATGFHDALSSPDCVTITHPTASQTVYTFTGTCHSANGGTMTGTITDTLSGTGPVVHTSVYALHVVDGTGTKQWDYTGTKLVTIDLVAQQATLTVPTGSTFTIQYTDTANSANDKTYHYLPNLTTNWATVGQLKLWGTYAFQQTLPTTTLVTATIDSATPLIWTTGCQYPTSGTLVLAVSPASATAVFGPNCGDMTLNGYSLPLGQ